MEDDVAVSLDLRNYELLWPAALFASEGERVLRASNSAWEDRAIWLMTEALAGTTAVTDFEEVPRQTNVTHQDPWTSEPLEGMKTGPDRRDWFTELVNRAAELRTAAAPRPYWPQRHGSGLSHDGTTPATVSETSRGSSASSLTAATWSKCSARNASTIPTTCLTPPRPSTGGWAYPTYGPCRRRAGTRRRSTA